MRQTRPHLSPQLVSGAISIHNCLVPKLWLAFVARFKFEIPRDLTILSPRPPAIGTKPPRLPKPEFMSFRSDRPGNRQLGQLILNNSTAPRRIIVAPWPRRSPEVRSGRTVAALLTEEQPVMPFNATLPRLPPEIWQRIDRALINLDSCMAAAPCHPQKIEADATYVEQLAIALKEAGAAIQAAHLKNDVIDARSWPTESQAESWARALLLQ